MPHRTRKPGTNGSPAGKQANGAADKPAASNGEYQSKDDQIRLRAYELYVGRGGRPDDAVGNWLRAEAEIRDETSRRSPDNAQ